MRSAAARPRAISTLQSIASRQENPDRRTHLLSLAEQAARISTWTKADALEKLLTTLFKADPGEKVLLFTHFRRTLDLLAERLRSLDISFVVYHGGMDSAAKNQAIVDFQSGAQVLLSTEAAGEGRNLQFCHTMVNFDVPWNPMRIEQRVGRIHRVGQDARSAHLQSLGARHH